MQWLPRQVADFGQNPFFFVLKQLKNVFDPPHFLKHLNNLEGSCTLTTKHLGNHEPVSAAEVRNNFLHPGGGN